MNLIVFPILIYYIAIIQGAEMLIYLIKLFCNFIEILFNFSGNPIIIDTFEDDWEYNIPPEDKPLLLPNEVHHTLPAVGKIQVILLVFFFKKIIGLMFM